MAFMGCNLINLRQVSQLFLYHETGNKWPSDNKTSVYDDFSEEEHVQPMEKAISQVTFEGLTP